MPDNAVVLGVTGIVVSGVVGPTVAAWHAERARRRDFYRSQLVQRRDELRVVLDEAARVLASGATNLRVLLHSASPTSDQEDAKRWVSQLFPLGNRLQLWLPAAHPLVCSYESVRLQLVGIAESPDALNGGALLAEFERQRQEFLTIARETLLQPISDPSTLL